MSVFDRVQQDEANGDLASAKNRLCSHALSTRFEPSVCEQIARICVRMQNPIEAGRWYFLSESTDAESAPSIEVFRATHRGAPRQIISQLPQGAKNKPLEDWTPAVSARLKEIGFTRVPICRKSVRRSTFADRFYPIGCVLFVIVGIGLALIGLRTVADWLR